MLKAGTATSPQKDEEVKEPPVISKLHKKNTYGLHDGLAAAGDSSSLNKEQLGNRRYLDMSEQRRLNLHSRRSSITSINNNTHLVLASNVEENSAMVGELSSKLQSQM